jgi:hypothetical protein
MKPVTPEQIRKLQAKLTKAEQGFSGERMQASRSLLQFALERYARQQLAREVVSMNREVELLDSEGGRYGTITPSPGEVRTVASNWRTRGEVKAGKPVARIVKVTRYRRAK